MTKTKSPQLKFAAHISSKTDHFAARDGVGYRWVGTHWEAQDEAELAREAIKFLARFEPSKANEKLAVSSAATAILLAPELPKPAENTIPTKNGVVSVGESKITVRPACQDDGVTYVLNCEFKEGANCPLFSTFLEAALPNEEVRHFLQEYAGYTLLGDTRHQIAAWLIGEGGTGKGTFAFIMQALHRQTVALNLDGLDGFKLAGLQTASLVCVDETPQRIDEQRLKTLISGDVVQVDRKYRDPLTIRPTAKWIVNGNALPAITDHTSGFWRRWVIFPFNVRPLKPQPLLAEQIIDQELSGVLNWCLAGLQRLLKRGEFPTLPEEMKEALSGGKQQSNSVAAWIDDDGIETGVDACNTRADVFARYSWWCSVSHARPVGVQKFWERMKVIFPAIPDDRTADRKQVGGKRLATVKIFLPPCNS